MKYVNIIIYFPSKLQASCKQKAKQYRFLLYCCIILSFTVGQTIAGGVAGSSNDTNPFHWPEKVVSLPSAAGKKHVFCLSPSLAYTSIKL